MTIQENQAIVLLTKMIEQHIAANGKDHEGIVKLLVDLESRLVDKLNDGQNRMDVIEQHCRERRSVVDEQIANAQQAAVSIATTPSPIKQVGRSAVYAFAKSLGFVSLAVGIAVGIDHIWGG
jgi:hypothetical protein